MNFSIVDRSEFAVAAGNLEQKETYTSRTSMKQAMLNATCPASSTTKQNLDPWPRELSTTNTNDSVWTHGLIASLSYWLLLLR